MYVLMCTHYGQNLFYRHRDIHDFCLSHSVTICPIIICCIFERQAAFMPVKATKLKFKLCVIFNSTHVLLYMFISWYPYLCSRINYFHSCSVWLTMFWQHTSLNLWGLFKRGRGMWKHGEKARSNIFITCTVRFLFLCYILSFFIKRLYLHVHI
jgi:hypothetical protein